MSEAKHKTIALNICLMPVEHFDLPHQANYSNVGVVQGIASLDFGFIEPALLGVIARAAKDGQVIPKAIKGHRITRMAKGVDVSACLHQ